MFKKIIILSLIIISLSSCMDIDDDKNKNDDIEYETIDLNEEDLKMIENILEINE